MIDYFIGIKIRDENRLQQTIAIFEALRSVNNFFYARKCRKSKYRNGRHFYTKHSWFTTRGNKLDLAIFIPPPISKGIRLMALDLFCLFQSPSLLSYPAPLTSHPFSPIICSLMRREKWLRKSEGNSFIRSLFVW